VSASTILFLGSGAVAGVIAWSAGNEAVGRTLVIYVCLCMFLSGVVVLAAGGPPLIALIGAVL
jgi:putative membrane protein